MSLKSREYVFPPALRSREMWCPWAFDEAGRKRPRAPHMNDHCYPVAWGAGADERPETDFETCMKYVRLQPYELDGMGLDFPPDSPDETLRPGILLPHEDVAPESEDERIVQVDFDDVRDPETGKVHPAARDVIRDAESYAALSSSGEGIHLLVFGKLPPGYGKLIVPLDDEPFGSLESAPQIEIYDHGRVAALTGEHIDMTPVSMSSGQDIIERFVERDRELSDDDGREDPPSPSKPRGSTGGSGGNASSPYYSKDVIDFAPAECRGSNQSHTHGAHPVHGGTSSADSESMNYHVDVDSNLWHCFAHDSGGGPLEMAAVMAGKIACRNAGEGALERLDDEEFLEVCLRARREGFDGKPPYRALVAIAKAHGLAFADPDEEILGESAYSVALTIYENTPT